jgi:hypothetical protein
VNPLLAGGHSAREVSGAGGWLSGSSALLSFCEPPAGRSPAPGGLSQLLSEASREPRRGREGGESGIDDAQFLTELVAPFQEEAEPLGEAGLSATEGEKTRIVLELDHPPAALMRADIRRGACDGPVGLGVQYLLTDVEVGKSSTVLDVGLAELRRGGYIIVVQSPSEQAEVGGICGNLSDAVPAEEFWRPEKMKTEHLFDRCRWLNWVGYGRL